MVVGDGRSSEGDIGIVGLSHPPFYRVLKARGRTVSADSSPRSFRGTVPAGEVGKPVSIETCAPIASRMQLACLGSVSGSGIADSRSPRVTQACFDPLAVS